jgi:hypothetical protein
METYVQFLYRMKWYFFAIVPYHLQRENLFCLSHCKTHRTMIMDNVALQINLLGTSSSTVIHTFLS